MEFDFIWLLVASVALASVSQIILKIGAAKPHRNLFFEYCNPPVILGYGLMVLSTVLTVVAFAHTSFKNAPVIEALGYVFVLVLSRAFLKEKITPKKLAGNLLILLGIAVFYWA